MNYITDLTFVSWVFATFALAIIIMMQIIKALASAVSLKIKKQIN